MKNKESFILYLQSSDVFNFLTNDEAGALIKAIFAYESTGAITSLDRTVECAFLQIKSYLDKNSQKYAAICEKRREYGKMGGVKKCEADSPSPIKEKKLTNKECNFDFSFLKGEKSAEMKEALEKWAVNVRLLKGDKMLKTQMQMQQLFSNLQREFNGDYSAIIEAINISIGNGWMNIINKSSENNNVNKSVKMEVGKRVWNDSFYDEKEKRGEKCCDDAGYVIIRDPQKGYWISSFGFENVNGKWVKK